MNKKNLKKRKNIRHINPLRIVASGHKVNDAKFLSGNGKVLTKLQHIFAQKA